MNHHSSSLVAILALAVLLPAGGARAELSEPEHIVYGLPSVNGAAVSEGSLVTLTLGDDPTVIASYVLGSDSALGGLYALRVPLDSVGERAAGKARTGDTAKLFLDGTLAGAVLIGERGSAQFLEIDPVLLPLLDRPAISIVDVDIFEGDAGITAARFRVVISNQAPEDVEVDWITRAGTAQGFDDFELDLGRVTIPSGELEAEIVIDVFGDLDPETDETFFIDLSNPLNASLLDREGRAIIRDDDTPPTIAIEDATVNEPASGAIREMAFTLRLSHPWKNDVSVDFFAEDILDSAVLGTDYAIAAGTLILPAGTLSATITAEVFGDVENEGEESFLVRLINPVEATLADAEAEGRIFDFVQFLRWLETQSDGVASVDGLAGAFAVAVSPDGSHVYAAGRAEDSIAVFDRDPTSGALTFKARYRDGQGGVDGLDGIEAVLVSHDGAKVFAAGFNDNAVALFARDVATGLLTFLEAERDGGTDADTGRVVDGLRGANGLAEAPGGAGGPTHLYVTGFEDDAVAIFTVAADHLEYETQVFDGGDFGTDGLDQASGVVVSPDGANVYVAGRGDNAVAVFRRRPADGFLIFVEQQKDGFAGVDGLAGALALAISDDGRHLYATGQLESAVTVFSREPSVGRLSFRQTLKDADASFEGLAQASSVALSRSEGGGDFLYATGFGDDALVVFSRAADGTLTFLETKRDGDDADGLDGANALAVSPDDRSVYAAGSLESALAVFVRDVVPPSDPTTVESLRHAVGVASADPRFAFRWSGAEDLGSGVAEYWALLDTNADTVPAHAPGATRVEHLADPHSVELLADTDHDGYFFHLSSCDEAGNCTNTVHLGPFPIDTTAPDPPGDVITTTHAAPSVEKVIEMSWTTPVEASPVASALVGYAFIFSLLPDPQCDQELDAGPEATSAASPPLPAGEWYFHICAGDEAGNFSQTVSVGPLVVEPDLVPPRVLRVETVARKDPGELAEGEVLELPLTQLVVSFSKPLSEGGAGDVRDPANYRLLDAGEDRVITTASCDGAPAGDDADVAIDDVVYDAATDRVAVRINGGDSLGLGRYRLLLCDRLVDLNGNILDGDDDGVAGGDFGRGFAVHRTNLLRNPNFDRGLEPWAAAVAPFGYDAEDAEGVPTSGSLALRRRGGDPLDFALTQCVDLTVHDVGAPLVLSGLVRLHEGAGHESRIIAGVELHDAPDCANAVGGRRESEPVIGDLSGVWHGLELEIVDPPAGTVSARVDFAVTIPESFDFDAHFDRLVFGSPDHRAPLDPIVESSSHIPGVWSADTTVDVAWQGASDGGLGVAEYRILFDQGSTTLPDGSTALPHVADPHTTTSAPLGHGAWHFHLSTCDLAGNCTGTVHTAAFLIDTLPPAGISPTASAAGDRLEASWSPPADPGSGVDGFSVSVTPSATGTCDRIKTLAADVTELSRPLPSGDWFFHICAVDRVGHWSAVETAGPISIVDDVAPEVVRVDTVAGAPDGSLAPEESVEVAVTQLLIAFSEDMAADVDLAERYRLLAPGTNHVLDAATCADLFDDEPIPIDQVVYHQASRTVALKVNHGRSLGADTYRLLICDSLSDLSGNPLSGGGDLVLLDFQIAADNLLINPNFDNGLGGWAMSEDLDTGAGFSIDDADGAVTSGSTALEVIAEPVSFGQCVELGDASLLRLSGRVRIEQLGAEAAQVFASLTWFSDPGCGGTSIAGGDTPPVIGDTGGAWQSFALASAPRPAGVASALVAVLAIPDPTDGQARIGLDSLSCLDLLMIFGDGFESGDTSAWSQVVGVP